MTATVAGRIPVQDSRASPRQLGRGLVWTLIGVFFGLNAGVGWWVTFPSSWNSTGTVVLSGVHDFGSSQPGRLYIVNGLAQNSVPLLNVLAESDVVADAAAQTLGLEDGVLRGAVTARPVPGTAAVEITVTRSSPTGLVNVTNTVMRTAIAQTGALQTQSAGRVLAQADIGSAASRPVDGRRSAFGFILSLSVVIGGGIGAAAASVRRPVPAELRLARWNLDDGIRVELGRWRSSAQRPAIRVMFAFALLLLVAHGATGSSIPVLLLGLLCCAAALRDLRWVVVGSLLLGLGAPNPRIKLVGAGSLTLSIQDVLLIVGVSVLLWRWWLRRSATRERAGLFARPLIAYVCVVGLGAAVGYLGGADRAGLAEPVRVLLILPATYLVVVQAYRRRPAQLVLTMIGCSVVSTSLALLATPLGWGALLGDVRDYVITDTSVASVTRLANPVLVIWSALLVVLAAGVAKGTSKWLWVMVSLPGAVLVALSFNRSTWGPLIAVVILAAAFRGGVRGIVRRATLVVVVGVIVLSVATTGALGPQVNQLGIRAMSAITGQATQSNSLQDRLVEDRAAVATLEEHPLFGTGLGRPYGAYSVDYDSARNLTIVSERPFIHNQYLRLWLFLGIPGLAVFLWLVARLSRAIALLVRSAGTSRSAVPLAVALGLLCAGFQAIFQTSLLDRPTMILTGLSLALIEICVQISLQRLPSASLDDQTEIRKIK